MMIITREFVLAVVEGVHALRNQADELSKTSEYKDANGVGNILRSRVESSRQCADMLSGWVRRNLDAVGYPSDQFDI